MKKKKFKHSRKKKRSKVYNSKIFTISRIDEDLQMYEHLDEKGKPDKEEYKTTRTYKIYEKKDRFNIFELQRKDKKEIPVKTIKKTGVIYNINMALNKVSSSSVDYIHFTNKTKQYGTKRLKDGRLVRDSNKIVISEQSNFYKGSKKIQYGKTHNYATERIPTQIIGKVLVTNTDPHRGKKPRQAIIIAYSYGRYDFYNEDMQTIKKELFKMARAKYSFKYGMGRKGNSDNRSLECELIDYRFIRRYSIGKTATNERLHNPRNLKQKPLR